MDWKMKFMSLVFRESQAQWFGKAGIPWHGAMALMKYVPPDDQEDGDMDDYTMLFFDFMTDHKKEGSFSSLSMLEGMFKMPFWCLRVGVCLRVSSCLLAPYLHQPPYLALLSHLLIITYLLSRCYLLDETPVS